MDNAHLRGKYYKNKKEMEDAYRRGDILGYIERKKDKNEYIIYTNEDSFDKYLALINEHIAKKRFITEDWDTLWKEISQLS